MPLTIERPVRQIDRAQRELARRARVELAKRHPVHYAAYADPDQAGNYRTDHLVLIGDYLQRAESGELWADTPGGGLRILVIEAPPRHWKTSIVNKSAAWFVGKRKNEKRPHQIIMTSYAATLAERNSRNVMETVINPLALELFPLALSRKSQAVNEWSLAGEPFPTCVAAGVGGGLTGQGADCLVIDDPVKDFADANSPSSRENKWQWWLTVARTRVNPDGYAVICLTRWHDDDIVGRMLKQVRDGESQDRIIVLRLPALAETEKERLSAGTMGLPVDTADPLGRAPGEALWPDRYSRDELLATQAIGPAAFEALYQGRPRREGGYLIGRHHFRTLEEAPADNIKWVWAIDWAFTEKEVAPRQRSDPDFTCLGLIGLWTPEKDRRKARIVIGDVYKWQLALHEVKRHIRRVVKMRRVPIVSLNDNIDKVAIQDMMMDPELFGHSIKLLPRLKGDKVTKAQPWLDRAQGGLVYVVNGNWNSFFYETVEGFPRAAHDDEIDMVTTGVAYHGLLRASRQANSARVEGFG